MKEGLLLNGVALHAADISPGDVEFPAAIETHLAHAGLPFRNRTTVTAGIAAKPIAIQRLPKLGRGFLDALIEDFSQGSHNNILLLCKQCVCDA